MCGSDTAYHLVQKVKINGKIENLDTSHQQQHKQQSMPFTINFTTVENRKSLIIITSNRKKKRRKKILQHSITTLQAKINLPNTAHSIFKQKTYNIIIIEKIEERLKKLENNNYILKKDTD